MELAIKMVYLYESFAHGSFHFTLELGWYKDKLCFQKPLLKYDK